MQKQNFNSDWIVAEIGNSKTEKGLGHVTLPHDAMIYTKRSADNPAGGACGWYAGGNYEYSKKFVISQEDVDKTIILEFEGIYNRGYVYVNDCFVGSVHYGYTRLIIDITAYVKYDVQNEVKVKVINVDVPNSRWYTGSGLYRPVNLYVGGKVRIGVDGLRITTPEVAEDVSEVRAEVILECDEKNQKIVKLEMLIKDEKSNVVAREIRPVTLLGSGKLKVTQSIYIKNANLWSTETPHLYYCEARILEDGNILDSTESAFGIRKVTIDPVYGLRINGKKVLLRGGCVHHDNGPLGAATLDRAEERRVEIMKKAGFNAIRIAHNTASKAMLNACDRIGMLVIDETYDVWNNCMSTYDYSLDFADHWEEDVEDFTAKDFNHPSVIMYSIGNEIPETGLPDGEMWNRKIAQKIRELDSTRFITNAINGLLILMREGEKQMSIGAVQESLAADDGINDVMTEMLGKMNDLAAVPMVAEKLEASCADLDLSGYNYMRGVYEIYKEQYPNRIYYGSETLPPDIDLNWKLAKKIPACIGDFSWTAWDYIGEAGVGVVDYDKPVAFMEPYPVYLAYCGDIDLIGKRRPMSYYREIVFGLRKVPYIAVQLPQHYGKKAGCTPWIVEESVSSWSWNGYEGRPCKVEVYSDAEEIELVINGKSCGRKKTGEENRFKAIFDVVYEPGKIEAISYRDGQAAEKYELKTASTEKKIKIQADREKIATNDIAYVEISLEDQDGVVHTDVRKKVKVSVEGTGKLCGLGSADPASTENFYDKERTLYYGEALAIIRSGEVEGETIVKVEAEGCTPVCCKLLVENRQGVS